MFMTERHIFISYRRADPDYTFAHQLADDLRAAGHPVWIDVEGIDGADEWAREIQEAIDQCYAYLIILSPDSVESTWVRKELIYALGEKQGRIYPVLYRDVRVPFELGDIQYTDFLRQGYEAARDRLLAALPSPDGLLPIELFFTVESERPIVRRGAVSALMEFARQGRPGQQERAEQWLAHLREADPDERVRSAADSYFNPPEPPTPVEQVTTEPVVAREVAPQAVEMAPVRSGFAFKPWMWAAGALVLVGLIAGGVLLLADPGKESAAINEAAEPSVEHTEQAGESAPADVPPSTATTSPTDFPAAEEAVPAADPTDAPLPTPTPFGGGRGLIAFIAQSPESRDIYDLYVINASGGNPIRLTSGDVNIENFSWSPDGTRLVYLETLQGAREGDLYITNADGSGRELIAQRVTGHTWMPDGYQIVALIADGSNFFYSYAEASEANWPGPWPRLYGQSPDGTMWIYDSDEEARGGEIYLYENATETSTRLTYNEVTERSEGWTPDGRILFSSNRSGDYGVYIMDADGENVTLVADQAWLEDIMADGEHLLVNSWRDGIRRLYSVSLDGQEWLRLTEESANSGAAVSPDGTKIAYPTFRDLIVMDADGSNPVIVTSFSDVRDEILWQPSQ